MTPAEAVALSAQLLPDARKWCRRSSTTLDDEIQQTVGACLLDMKNAGITKIDGNDPLIKQAVKLYLKGYFGCDDQPEKWQQAYDRLKAALSLSGDYTGPVESANE